MTSAYQYALDNHLMDGFAPSISPLLALGLRASYGLRTFVETGIWHGGTTQWAALHFDTVYTCDLDPVWVEHARKRFADTPNVVITQADSREFLAVIIQRLRQPALIYLDAHYIADKHSAGDPGDCPLMGELRLIEPVHTPHVVVIDDARLIVERDPDYLSWPTFDQVKDALPRHNVKHERKAIVCVPKEW